MKKSIIVYEAFARAYPGKTGKKFHSLEKDLERLKTLGVNAVWLMPIHPTGSVGRKGALGSPYAIKDYYEIDPILGTKEDFKNLVQRAHELNMRIIMDMVLNHTALDSVLFQEHPEWFLRDERGNFLRKVPEWSDVIDLDYTKPELREYMIRMMEYWVREFDVDGFRCDVAGLVPLDFWVQARKRLNAIKELIWISETHDPYMYKAFDVTYDYDGYYKFRDYLAGRCTLKDYVDFLKFQDRIYPVGYVKMRFLENHDQVRIAKLLPEEKLRHWVVFLFTVKGIPLIHNGQEYGLKEEVDLFNHYELPIADLQAENQIYSLHKKMGFYRSKMDLFKEGEMIFLSNSTPNSVITYLWRFGNKFALCVLNPELHEGEVEVDFAGIFENVSIHAKDIVSDDLVRLSVKNSKTRLVAGREPMVLSFVLY